MRTLGGKVDAERTGSGRTWAWLLLLVGSSASIAVSVAHAYMRPAGAGEQWRPVGSALGWALVWGVLVPLMLFVVVKAVTGIRWPNQRRWTLLRWLGAVPAAGLAGYVSWSHMSGLLRSNGEDWLVCVLAWLAVDGLMFLGIGGLLATRSATAAGSTRRPMTSTDGNGSGLRAGRTGDVGLGLFTTTGRGRGA